MKKFELVHIESGMVAERGYEAYYLAIRQQSLEERFGKDTFLIREEL